MEPIERIRQLGFSLPTPKAPLANYVPITRVGDVLFISGQLPVDDNGLRTGTVGGDVELSAAREAAKLCVLNILAQIEHADDTTLADVTRFVRMGVYVASAPTFLEQHLVANGASDLIGEIFGDRGRHVRAAVGVSALPLGAIVEIEATVEIKSNQ